MKRAKLIPILCACVLLQAQDPPAAVEPISTDRPSVANSSVVVPVGAFQFENGILFSTAQGQNSFDGSETSLRYGIANNTELRLGVPDYYRNIPGVAGAVSGFGDLSVGVKRQLGPAAGFDVSLIAFVSLPTGAAAVSSHGYDPGLQLPWSRKLSDNWVAAGQLAVYWPSTQSDRRTLTGESTFLLDRQLTKAMDAFIEYAGDFPQRAGPRHLLHFGASYKIATQQQIDVHVGVGLSAAAIDHFAGVGYSVRF